MCKLHSRECVEQLLKIVRDPEEKTSHQLQAISTILAYGNGKPRASVDVVSTYDITMDFLEALRLVNNKVAPAPEPTLIEATPIDEE